MKYHRYISILFVISAVLVKSIYASELPQCDLRVELYPLKNKLTGYIKIDNTAGRQNEINIEGLLIKSVKIDGKEYKYNNEKKIIINTQKSVEISYSKTLNKNESHNNSNITLLDTWYPQLKGLCKFKLTAEMPAEFDAVSESEKVDIKMLGDKKIVKFIFPHVVPKITLIAGKYNVLEEDHEGILIKVYLFSKEKKLARKYISHTKRYIKLYNSLLGEYPYKSFSVVENIHQTGYSFPTYTLLGSRVIRLPFILKTSLGHEILHQWFGNSVYVDHNKGNWCEGLTSYLADHWYKHLNGQGPEYRKKILIDYENYIDPGNEKPLKEFKYPGNLSSRAVGYGKCAMLFHMLRERLGHDKFLDGLKKFIKNYKYKFANWEDIRSSFTQQDDDLKEFFNQWLDRKGNIRFSIKEYSTTFRNGKYILSFQLIQQGDTYTFKLPVRVITEKDEINFNLNINKKQHHFKKALTAKPLKIYLDENYDLFRGLSHKEKPPVLSAIIGSKNCIVLKPESDKEIYESSFDYLKRKNYKLISENDVLNKDLVNNSFVILSANNRVSKRLFAGKQVPDAGMVAEVFKNPFNPLKAVLLVNAKNVLEFKSAFRKIFRYGNYSSLSFNMGKNINKKLAESDMGIIKDIRLDVNAIETKKINSLDEVIEKIKDKKIIYIGEMHTSYSHHIVQYEIIKSLYEKKGSLVIGMEMFQRPFQEYLDMYIRREIEEDEFLKKTEYFKRWGYDYNLYRDILHYARDKKIPVIALNMRQEITKKIIKSGIDSLTENENKDIPENLDMANEKYRGSMLRVYKMHPPGVKMDFNSFYQAQILWDETMAQSVSDTLKKYPHTSIVVLAGNGHLQYSWGIPGRVKRKNNVSFSVILNGNRSGMDKDAADFVLLPERIKKPASPKLKVMLKEKSNGIEIISVLNGGPAQKAGLIKGDVILSIDGKKIKDVSDLKIFLFNKKKGDVIKLKVKRKNFILFEEVLDIDVFL